MLLNSKSQACPANLRQHHGGALIIFLLAIVALILLLFVAGRVVTVPAPPPAAIPTTAPSTTTTGPAEPSTTPEGTAPVIAPLPSPTSASNNPERASNAANRPISPYTQQLVSALVQPVAEGATATPEQAAAWKERLKQLIQQGPEAIPAIAEFLAKNTDYTFASGKASLGYTSARAAMVDALAQIGGPDAVAALSTVLQSAAEPGEIARVATALDHIEPGTHRQEALAAATEALNMARDGQLSGIDVAPLFEVLRRYGDASVATQLENNARNWNYYSMMALAQLPDEAGIPSLVRIAFGENPAVGNAREGALQMLAQTAPQSPAAREALVQLAREKKLSAYSWAALAPYLAGDQAQFSAAAYGTPQDQVQAGDMRSTHIAAGNQNFYSLPPPGGLPPETAGKYLSLIQDLLAVTQDQAATDHLNRAAQLIAQRTAQPAPASGGLAN